MNSQHDDAKDWNFDLILQKLRETNCSQLSERFFDSNTLLHVAARLGNDQIVEAILSIQQCQELLMVQNSNGDLPLHVAANAGHLSIVQHLVSSSPQHHELLMAKNSNGDLPLHVAANAGHVSIVQHLVSPQHHELLMAKNSSGDLPLHVAANAGHLLIVQHLVSSSPQHHELLMAQNSNGDLPLHLAAKAGHLSIVKHLVSSCPQRHELLMAKNSKGDLPLHVAAHAGHLSIVQHLVSSSPQHHELLMAQNSNGDLPLHVAVNAGNLSIVQYLVKLSNQCQELLTTNQSSDNIPLPHPPVDANAWYQSSVKLPHQQLQDHYTSKPLEVKNREGNTPLQLALEKINEAVNKKSSPWRYQRVAMSLIVKDPAEERKELPKKEDTKKPMVYDAMMRRERYKPSRTLETKVSYESKDKVTGMDGELYKAVKGKDIDFILNKGRDLEHSALSDKTPELNTILHLAAASSDDDHQFVQAILAIQLCQNFVTEKNSKGDLPLHVAASAGNMQIVELLVQWSDEHSNCVPLGEKNMEGNTPLHLALIKKFQVCRNWALKAKYNMVAKFLVEKCPEVSFYPNKESKYPLYLAAEGGDEELVKHMITTNHLPAGRSIVHAAIYYLMTITNLPYCKSIVHTAIYTSFTARKKGILDTVLESLPNDILTVKDHEGMTPLFYAASLGYLKGVESLLRKTTKCCVYNERNAYGFYPIHIASSKGHIKVVEKFLHEYPDMIELLTAKGENILHVAAKYGKAKLVAYMLERHDLKVEMLINNEDQIGNTPLHLAAMIGHPMVVSILTWDKRVDLKALNKAGKRALDIALYDSNRWNPSFPERLTWQALRYVSSPRAPPRRINYEEPLTTAEYQSRTETLLLVATLVATVTFAAAFTMPGGYKDSGGMAKFLEKPMFHVFVISNSIAMYSAITAVVALIWARLDDLNLFIAAYNFSVPMLGLAITMVSLAFMAGNYLVLRDHNWLAYLVLSIGSFFLFTLSIIFFPLCLPNSSPHPIIRYILRYPFYLLIIFTRCDTDDGKEEFTHDTDDGKEKFTQFT